MTVPASQSQNWSSGKYHVLPSLTASRLTLSERIRGIAVRHSTVVVALRYKVLAYRLAGLSDTKDRAGDPKGKAKAVEGFGVEKIGEWETAENEAGAS